MRNHSLIGGQYISKNDEESQLDRRQHDAPLGSLMFVLLTLALHLVYPLKLLPNLTLQVSPLRVVYSSLLDDFGTALDHQHLPVQLLLPVSVPLHVV